MSNNLKKIREHEGLSLQWLGEMTGKKRGAIHAMEKPGANPTLKSARAVANALGKTVDEIWPNDDLLSSS